MSYTAEEKAARIAEARDLLADLDAADALRAASCAMPEPSAMQSFGLLPLLSSARAERLRAEAEEWQRKCEQEDAAMKAEQARIRREQQQAAERAARLEWTAEWAEVLGEVIGEERKYMHAYVAEQLGLLRAELTMKRTAERGEIIDLPALPLRRRGNAA